MVIVEQPLALPGSDNEGKKDGRKKPNKVEKETAKMTYPFNFFQETRWMLNVAK